MLVVYDCFTYLRLILDHLLCNLVHSHSLLIHSLLCTIMSHCLGPFSQSRPCLQGQENKHNPDEKEEKWPLIRLSNEVMLLMVLKFRQNFASNFAWVLQTPHSPYKLQPCYFLYRCSKDLTRYSNLK